MENIFEQASRKKLRFTTTRGQVSVEDLWDLSLEDLDQIAKAVNKTVKESTEESFIKKTTTANKLSTLKLNVVVSIINTKMEEAEKRKEAANRKAKRDQILKLIEEKQNDSLGRKSIKALQDELDKLEEVELEA